LRSDASEALVQRPGIQIQPLAPLDVAEARGIAEAICARYRTGMMVRCTFAFAAEIRSRTIA
jgi:hypothetical protein